MQIYEFHISKIIIVSDIRDHSSKFCILKSVKDKVTVNKFKVRNFSQFSADCFNAELSQVDWNAIVERKLCDVNDLTFNYEFSSVLSCENLLYPSLHRSANI